MSEEQNSDSQEKSHEATESKIRKSREKGDVAQSTELNTLLLYIGLIVGFFFLVKSVTMSVFTEFNTLLTYPSQIGAAILESDKGIDSGQISNLIWKPILKLWPILGLLILSVCLSLIFQRSVVFSPDKLKFKLSRISPISNAKQKYGQQGLFEFLKRVVKLTFISTVAIVFVISLIAELPGRAAMAPVQVMSNIYDLSIQLTACMVVAMAVIVLIDWPYAYFSHLKKLRMSTQELKDETKESEGDPYMKQVRRGRALEISQSSMLQDVRTADVVITNPTHYAVALRWDRQAKSVPIVVAKGVDELAARIRQQAALHDVAIHPDPPCARSLYATVEIGEAINPHHYAAVAASIRYADSLKPKDY